MQYRRLIIPGTTYFFTVVLQDRRSDLLIQKINELRQAFKQVIERYPLGDTAYNNPLCLTRI